MQTKVWERSGQVYPIEGLELDWEALDWVGKHLDADDLIVEFDNGNAILYFRNKDRIDVIVWNKFMKEDSDGSGEKLRNLTPVGEESATEYQPIRLSHPHKA